jgi:hypothetical protein
LEIEEFQPNHLLGEQSPSCPLKIPHGTCSVDFIPDEAVPEVVFAENFAVVTDLGVRFEQIGKKVGTGPPPAEDNKLCRRGAPRLAQTTGRASQKVFRQLLDAG